MKDAVSRILVEMMKHVWPQLWADLFQKLHDICQHGVSVVLVPFVVYFFIFFGGSLTVFVCYYN